MHGDGKGVVVAVLTDLLAVERVAGRCEGSQTLSWGEFGRGGALELAERSQLDPGGYLLALYGVR